MFRQLNCPLFCLRPQLVDCWGLRILRRIMQCLACLAARIPFAAASSSSMRATCSDSSRLAHRFFSQHETGGCASNKQSRMGCNTCKASIYLGRVRSCLESQQANPFAGSVRLGIMHALSCHFKHDAMKGCLCCWLKWRSVSCGKNKLQTCSLSCLCQRT